MKTDQDIRFFLRMGYFPGYAGDVRLDYSVIDRERYKDAVRADLIEMGAAAWRGTIGTQFKSGKRNVVPLSGGMDSRAILAGLLECTEARDIETYTFGTPGTYDFDIGCRVAEKAGTKHTAIPLDHVPWSIDDFVDAAERFDHQTFLFHHAPVRILDQFADGVIWSGYIGDVVTGGHCKAKSSKDLESAKVRYLQERRVVASIDLPEEDFSGFISAAQDVMTADERVRFAEMSKVTAPHVLMRGFDYRTPFINSPMWAFFMSVPDEFRIGQNLYIDMLETHWPKLFSLPSKSKLNVMQKARNKFYTLGREHLRVFDWPAHPMTNYMDLDRLLRTDINLMTIVHDQLMELKERDVVAMDIDGLWARHLSRAGNHADIIKILFSLEINLKGLEKQAAIGKVVGL